MKTRDWTEGQGDGAGWRVLVVDDGYVAHHCVLEEGEAVRDALADYAAGYDAGEPQEVTANWCLWEGGEEADRGRYKFEAK